MAVTTVRTKLNSAVIQQYLDGEHGVEATLRERAEAVLAAAQAGAPVDTGEYLDSLHIEVDHTDRMVVRVVADAYHAWIVEVTTGNLASALDAAG